MFIRIGKHVINLNAIRCVDLDDDDGGVAITMHGEREEPFQGQIGTHRYTGAEAEALRAYFAANDSTFLDGPRIHDVAEMASKECLEGL